MKKCPMCGTSVDDHASECPECGCPIADTSGFSLKSGSGANKKSGNPMGRLISSGSGLTDILREGDDAYDDYDDLNDGSYNGSMPISLSRTDIEGDYSVKKRKKIGKYIFRIILLAAAAYGIYYLVVNVFMTKKAKSYAEALDMFVDAINENDREEMELIMPPYLDNPTKEIDYCFNSLSNLHIDDFSKRDLVQLSKSDIEDLQDAIKLQTSKTTRIKEAYALTVSFKVTATSDVGIYAEGATFQINTHMEFINVNNKWYLQVDSYENIDYN